MNNEDLPSHLLARLTRRQPRDVASRRRLPADHHRKVIRASQIALAIAFAGLSDLTAAESESFFVNTPQASEQNQAEVR